MAVANRAGFPIAIYTDSASPHEVRLVRETLPERFTDEQPKRLIGDKAYDSDPLDKELKEACGVRRIRRTASKPKHRTGENCVATNDAGRLNACLRGCKIFVGFWCATNTMMKTI